MAKYKGNYPYLHMSKEELQSIDNDTLVKLVADFNKENVSITSLRYKEGMRLADEQSRRIIDGTLDRSKYWNIKN